MLIQLTHNRRQRELFNSGRTGSAGGDASEQCREFGLRRMVSLLLGRGQRLVRQHARLPRRRGLQVARRLRSTARHRDRIHGHAGFSGGFNTGVRLFDDSPIRGQIGGSYGVYDLKGRDTVSPSSAEQQTFLTAGIYKRSDILDGDAISWGLVYDQFWAHQWGLRAGELYVGQVRGIAGYAINDRHEIGVWGTFHTTEDATATVAGPPLRAMNQYNVYWRYNWDFGGQTMVYVGGNDPADVESWVLGVLGQAPLSDNMALYGNFTYAFPRSATGVIGSNDLEWNLGVGLIYSWGKKAVSPTVSGRKGLPLLPVANNGSFLITN